MQWGGMSKLLADGGKDDDDDEEEDAKEDETDWRVIFQPWLLLQPEGEREDILQTCKYFI